MPPIRKLLPGHITPPTAILSSSPKDNGSIQSYTNLLKRGLNFTAIRQISKPCYTGCVSVAKECGRICKHHAPVSIFKDRLTAKEKKIKRQTCKVSLPVRLCFACQSAYCFRAFYPTTFRQQLSVSLLLHWTPAGSEWRLWGAEHE